MLLLMIMNVAVLRAVGLGLGIHNLLPNLYNLVRDGFVSERSGVNHLYCPINMFFTNRNDIVVGI
jgi:hypothetical protein